MRFRVSPTLRSGGGAAPSARLLGWVAAVVLSLVLAGCGDGDGGDDGDAGGAGGGGSAPSGVQTYGELSQDHLATPVDYPQNPPVGGDHSPDPQTCGAYGQPIPNERGVHSMEHGAVWITHRPDLPGPQVSRLRSLARQSHVLVSPYPGLPAPVVASAWGRQVQLESADDPRLQQFLTQFRQGPQTPEPGASCDGEGTALG